MVPTNKINVDGNDLSAAATVTIDAGRVISFETRTPHNGMRSLNSTITTVVEKEENPRRWYQLTLILLCVWLGERGRKNHNNNNKKRRSRPHRMDQVILHNDTTDNLDTFWGPVPTPIDIQYKYQEININSPILVHRAGIFHLNIFLLLLIYNRSGYTQ